MNQVETLTAELAQAILNSSEYREYLKCSEIVKRDADIYRRVNDMRRYNFEIQNNADVGNVYDTAEELRKQYQEIRSIPQVKNFLMAEMSLGRMIQNICRNIVKDLEFDLSFLEG